MSRLIPFGKKSVTIAQDGTNVTIAGDTFPLRTELRAQLDTRWDSAQRRWIVAGGSVASVEAVVDAIVCAHEERERVRRADIAKRAAKTRRLRAGRWTDDERTTLQANYATWQQAGGDSHLVDAWKEWQTLCLACNEPVFSCVPDVALVHCPHCRQCMRACCD